jgi:transcriptional regulator with XRE-family HTH domain
MSIGSRIKETRKFRGMSQKDLAAKIGIKQPSLSELETGESTGTTYLARIASVLGVNPLWLETGKGSRDAADAPASGSMAGMLELKAETASELKMLVVYRSANDREREAIDDVVEQMRLLVESRLRNQTKLTG